MRVLTLALIGILATGEGLAEDIDRSMDADPNGLISISNVAGTVEVAGWSRNQVEITGTLGDDVEELVFERDGKEIEIKVKTRRLHSNRISSDLHVKVPSASSLEINTVSAEIEVAGVTGEQDLESVSGDIVSAAFSADINVDSVSGEIEVSGEGMPARADLNTVSGDIETENLAGEISVESVSGSLFVRSGAFQRATLGTVNGDIMFHAQLLDGARLDIETVNGEVEIEFAGEISARFDIETFNGGIRNCFGPEAVRVSKYGPGYELKFTEGDGSGRVTIETLNGNLRLCR
ncbi:MAG: DUF4097 family beta strand repeat-containing protein [Woeseiaceae bacterium]|nr:DUF4097 family beta strand repeat-containing protein [Woeseiaceae bacterium]